MVVLLKGEKIYFRLLLTLEENDCDKEIYDEELWDSKKKKKRRTIFKVCTWKRKNGLPQNEIRQCHFPFLHDQIGL